MTGFDLLTEVTHTRSFAIIWLCLQCVVAANLFSELLRHYMARGTRPRYVMTTVIRSTAVPAILVKMCDIVIDYADGDWFLVAMDVLVTMYIIMNWYWTKDEDNWWKGKGTKLKKKLQAAFTATSPVAAGA